MYATVESVIGQPQAVIYPQKAAGEELVSLGKEMGGVPFSSVMVPILLLHGCFLAINYTLGESDN